jgi:hypothetical protein
MNVSTPLIDRLLAAACSAAFALPAIGFIWMLGRTLFVSFLGDGAVAYRTGAVLTAAAFFLVTAVVCAAISFKFFEMARTGFQEK